MYSIISCVEKLIRETELEIQYLYRVLNNIPKGHLKIRTRDGKNYYSIYHNGKEQGIKKDSPLYSQIASKPLILSQLKILEDNCKTLKIASKNLRDAGASLVTLEWISRPNGGNPYKQETLKYKTASGILVRSKSEKLIADFLHSKGIAFKYEAPIEIEGKILYPDFTIIKRNGEIILWEHLGLTDNNNYFLNAINKIQQYRKAGFKVHKNLICTLEDDIMDDAVLEEIIDRFIVC